MTPVYALLLAAAVVTVAMVKPWRGLAAASAVATYAVLGLWVVVVDPPRAAVAAAAVAAFLTYLAAVTRCTAATARDGPTASVSCR